MRFSSNCGGKLGVSLELRCAIQGFSRVVASILATSRVSTRESDLLSFYDWKLVIPLE